jgi:beta-lactam-binding protein with PASTA domain
VDSDLPAGTVAATDPAPGSRVARGTTVVLYLSNGSQIGAEVPNVVGQPFEQAVGTLNGAGFANVVELCVPAPGGGGDEGDEDENGNGNGNGNGNENENTPAGPFGTVVGQNPGGGSQAKPQDRIELGVLRESC